jgi:hypothetical protein
MLGQPKTQTVYVKSAVTTLKEQTALETACLNVELLILAMRSDALFSSARDKVDPGTRTMKLQQTILFFVSLVVHVFCCNIQALSKEQSYLGG